MKRGCWVLITAALVLGGCNRQAELQACNIAKRPCQEDIYYAVMRLRGDGFDPFQGVPPIRTITLAEYRKQLIAEEPKASSGPAAKPKVDPWNAALQLLGLVTPSTSVAQASIDDRVRNVAAFYSSGTRDVTVIDRGDVHDDAKETTLLAHELVHAFQDSEQNANAGNRTTDGSFVTTSLTEGEAVLYEHLAGAEIRGVAPERIDWDGYYDSWADSLRQSMSQEKSPFYAVSWFVYPLGADLLTRAWLEGGNSAVRKLGTVFPQRSVDYMASLGHVSAGSIGTLSCMLDPPQKSYELTGLDRFGAMQLYGFLEAAGMTDADAWVSALHWREDVVFVFFDMDSEKVAVSWRIRMDNLAHAEAVQSAVSSGPLSRLQATRDGKDVSIVSADDPDSLAGWTGSAKCDH